MERRPCVYCGRLTATASGFCRFCNYKEVGTCITCGGPVRPAKKICRSCIAWGKMIAYWGPFMERTGPIPYGPEFKKWLKNIIRKRDGFICRICRVPENEHCHSIHHIDYDKQNNSQYNLITLCRSCHSKTTPGNREFWKGYFQSIISNIPLS